MCAQSINMFYTPWMGLKTLTLVVVGKQQPQVLHHGSRIRTTTLGPKHSFSTLSTRNASSYHHTRAWICHNALTIMK